MVSCRRQEEDQERGTSTDAWVMRAKAYMPKKAPILNMISVTAAHCSDVMPRAFCREDSRNVSVQGVV